MSKLQETTMTTPEQLKEEFDKWYKDQLEMNPYIMRDYWLNKFQSLLGEIEEKVEKINVSGGGNGRRLKVQILSIIQENKDNG